MLFLGALIDLRSQETSRCPTISRSVQAGYVSRPLELEAVPSQVKDSDEENLTLRCSGIKRLVHEVACSSLMKQDRSQVRKLSPKGLSWAVSGAL